MTVRRWLALHVLALFALLTSGVAPAQTPAGGVPVPSSAPVLVLAPGQDIDVHLCGGQAGMDRMLRIADDGTIQLPVAGTVRVAGLTPEEAAGQIQHAFVQLVLVRCVSVTVVPIDVRVQIVGSVRNPGRYPVDAPSTVLDMLARAGGVTDKAAHVVYLLRPDASGSIQRYPVDLRRPPGRGAALMVHDADRIVVPEVQQVTITGEVRSPAAYPLEPGMTVMQAVALAGGLTRHTSRVLFDIKRRQPAGTFSLISVKPDDPVQADDTIAVKLID
jgi:polysaccharide biosynthesis/export protein